MHEFDESEFKDATPIVDHEYVDVTFGSADTDYDIRHSLSTPTPDEIQYQVVRADRATSLYHDTSATRKAWTRDYIILRSSAASAVVRILLTVKRP
jgi:hypothetical protein